MALIKASFQWGDKLAPITVEVDTSMKVSEHFTIGELANNLAKDSVKYVSTPRHRKFMLMIEEMRYVFGSMTVNSCYRTASYNASVGGDAKSRHLYAEALDWSKRGVSSEYRTKVANKWQELCIKYREYGAVNYYTNGFHLEIGSDQSYGTKTFQIRDYRGKKGDW